MLSHQAVGEAEVVVRQRVVGVIFNHKLMTPDGLRIILQAEEVVGERIAYFLVLCRR